MPHVLITGAGRGIGLELAKRYAAAGWQVTATIRRPEAAAALPETVRSLALDVADSESFPGFASGLDQPLDLLINNAGIFGGKPQPLENVQAATWLDVFRVNTLAPLLLTRALLPQLRAGSGKKIVTITSRMGSLAENGSGGALMYRSSKSAVNMAMQCLSYDVEGDGLGVLLVHPGWVKTDMGGDAADITQADSAAGIVAVIDAFDPTTRLAFKAWDGRDIDW